VKPAPAGGKQGGQVIDAVACLPELNLEISASAEVRVGVVKPSSAEALHPVRHEGDRSALRTLTRLLFALCE
jgi:hypothetical protein